MLSEPEPVVNVEHYFRRKYTQRAFYPMKLRINIFHILSQNEEEYIQKLNILHYYTIILLRCLKSSLLIIIANETIKVFKLSYSFAKLSSRSQKHYQIIWRNDCSAKLWLCFSQLRYIKYDKLWKYYNPLNVNLIVLNMIPFLQIQDLLNLIIHLVIIFFYSSDSLTSFSQHSYHIFEISWETFNIMILICSIVNLSEFISNFFLSVCIFHQSNSSYWTHHIQ
jgi:hypothetical protein